MGQLRHVSSVGDVGPRSSARPLPRLIGRYALHAPMASGGMASVHFGRLLGPAGFSRTVAIKRLHPELVTESEFVTLFVDEARLAGRIHHANVVSILDVVSSDGELFLVMEYVEGESLAGVFRRLAERHERMPPRIAGAIVGDILNGLHAAHETRDEEGRALGVVHRDVSPQNVIVGSDGAARVLDFGIAKAARALHQTDGGTLRGKLAYMAPEQLQGFDVTRRADVYSTGVVLWEALAGKKLFRGEEQSDVIAAVLRGQIASPRAERPELPATIDDVFGRALASDPNARFDSARAMAIVVGECLGVAPALEVADWLQAHCGEGLRARAQLIAEIERSERSSGSYSAVRESMIVPRAVPDETTVSAHGLGTSAIVTASDDVIIHPAPPRNATPIARVRSTLLCSGLAAIRRRGLFERYLDHLPEHRRDAVRTLVAAVWLPYDFADDHFAALDALQLSAEEAFAVGAASGERLQGSFIRIVGRLAGGAAATPWSILGFYDRIWQRTFDGGGVIARRVDHNVATIQISETPFARFTYFRDAFLGANHAGLRKYARSLSVTEIPDARTPAGMALRVTWQ